MECQKYSIRFTLISVFSNRPDFDNTTIQHQSRSSISFVSLILNKVFIIQRHVRQIKIMCCNDECHKNYSLISHTNILMGTLKRLQKMFNDTIKCNIGIYSDLPAGQKLLSFLNLPQFQICKLGYIISSNMRNTIDL